MILHSHSTHHGHGGTSTTSIMSMSVAIPSSSSYAGSYEVCFAKDSSLSKADVVYIEMHATGTVRGDEAELESIMDFYCKGRAKTDRPLWLGGNKTTLGHTEPVSGLFSVAKILLAFESGRMPPTILMSDPADSLQEMSGFNVHLASAPVQLSSLQGLFCATSSGMSGTTAHVVLRPPSPPDKGVQTRRHPNILILHSHSKEAALKWRDRFADKWADLCLDRDHSFPKDGLLHRCTTSKAVVTIAAFEDDTPLSNHTVRELPPIMNPPPVVPWNQGNAAVVLAFGGVGLVQYGVGRRTYLQWPAFKKAVNYIE
jgi:hypothetical protein